MVVIVVVVAVVVVVVVGSGVVVKWEGPKSVILTKTHCFLPDPPTLLPLKINRELL